MAARKKFARQLASLLKQGKPVIFADEATWGPWDRYSIVKSWVDLNNPFTHRINSKAIGRVTMYGACSNVLPKLIFKTAHKTTIEGWKAFLLQLKKQLDDQYISKPVTLVIDGHPAHRSKKVIDNY